jgi:hypothetical protein
LLAGVLLAFPLSVLNTKFETLQMLDVELTLRGAEITCALAVTKGLLGLLL